MPNQIQTIITMMPLPYPHLLLTWLALAAPCYAFVGVRSDAVARHTKFRLISQQLLAPKSGEDDENLRVSRRTSSSFVARHTKFRPILRLLASKSDDSEDDENLCVSRRSLLQEVGVSIAGSVSAGPFLSLYRSFCTSQESNGANAMGLVHFPCKEGVLMNKYHLMRAGQSGLESQNILSTNPLFMTNTEDGLTELGLMQVEEACSQLIANNINPSVIKYSLA
eukprot:scaffold27335_cov72-Skeletonema_dohrnii-CCMP3373.AAC.1